MNTNRIWGMATVLAIVAVLALGWMLGVSPLLTRASTADTEAAGVEANNQAQLAALQVMKTQFDDLETLQADLEMLRVSVPANVDSDFVYSLLQSYQTGTGAAVKSIVTGEAQPYGLAGTEQQAEPGATAPGSVSGLFTVPVTITFENQPFLNVMSYVASLQRGPRLFLVTSVVGSKGEGAEETTTVTAFMFVMSDPDAPEDEAATALQEHGFDFGAVLTPLGPSPAPTPTPEPTPEPEAEPTPSP